MRSNEALEIVSIYNRTAEDHENFTSKIDQRNIYQVYNAMLQNLKNETSDISELITNSSTNHRQVYQYNGLVRKIL